MKITLRRRISGKVLINDLEGTYGSLKKLEKLYENNLNNLKLYADLDNWKYYQDHLDEELEDGRTISVDKTQLKILEFIINHPAKQFTDIESIMAINKRLLNYKLNNLKENDLIEFNEQSGRLVLRAKYNQIEVITSALKTKD